MSTPSWLIGSGVDTDIPQNFTPRPKNHRFFLKKGESRKIIFLTNGDDSPCIWEHEVLVDGRYQTVTCLKSAEGQQCPLCEQAEKIGKGRRYSAMFFTILDTTEWTDKGGKTHSNEKKMLVAKKDIVSKIKRKKEKLEKDGSSLRGAVFEVFRSNSDKSPRVGDEFEFSGVVNLEEYAAKHGCDITNFDYYDMLKPDPERVKQIVASLAGGLPAADEIPTF